MSRNDPARMGLAAASSLGAGLGAGRDAGRKSWSLPSGTSSEVKQF